MTDGRAMGSHHATVPGSDEWVTPEFVIDALGPFALDPCAAERMPWRTAAEMWSSEGLSRPWGDGLVWLNPPYTRGEIGRWLGRLADHPAGGVALIFARTETRDWHEFVWRRASGVLFLEGRLHFAYTDGRIARANAGAPSALVAYGEVALDRLVEAAAERRLPGALVYEWSHYRREAAAPAALSLFDDEGE